MSSSCFQIEQIPDLSLNKYQSLADTGVDGVLARHENFLRLWHGIGKESTTSFHLLYLFDPAEMAGKRLKLYFMLQGELASLQMVEPLLHNSPLSDFYTFKSANLPFVSFEAGATLIKKERLADIHNPLTGKTNSIHYVPAWEMNEEGRLYDLFRMMETIGRSYKETQPCAFRIDLYPASVEQTTRETFTPVLKALRGENEIKLLRDTDSVSRDGYARDISREYEDWLENIETTPHFRMNIYSFAGSTFQAKVLLNAAGAEAVSEGDYAIADIRSDSDGRYNLLSRLGQNAESYCFYPNQAHLKSWATTYCLPEVVPFFRLPVLYDGETIELPKETAPVQIPDGIYLGRDRNQYPVNFALKELPKHAFFTGMPGSGKTNTMLHLVTQLRKNHIPFLALEPAKKEYRALLGYPEMQDIFLFSPHLQSRFPLRMNPMQFPVGTRLSKHIDALMEVFQGTFTLEGPTHKFLDDAIEKSYTRLGWDVEDVYDENCTLDFPCLQDVYDLLAEEIEKSSYDSEVKGNVRAFLQVRLGGLMTRDAGELFNTSISTFSPEQWICESAIVELEVLGEQAKNFFVLLVCHYIFEALCADPSGGIDASGNKMPVRHVVFIEEAHNIIANSTQQASSDSIDPKISATAYIVKMLAEVRALREAIVIADQLPTALASEVTKNTGLKLVHRLAAQDDRQQIGAAISASPLQLEQMASFTTGRALIHHEKTLKPFEVQIARWIPPQIDYDIADEAQLYQHIQNKSNIQYQVTRAFISWQMRDVMPFTDEISALEDEHTAVVQKDDASIKTDFRQKKEGLLLRGKKMMSKCDRMEQLWLGNPNENAELEDALQQMKAFLQESSSQAESYE